MRTVSQSVNEILRKDFLIIFNLKTTQFATREFLILFVIEIFSGEREASGHPVQNLLSSLSIIPTRCCNVKILFQSRHVCFSGYPGLRHFSIRLLGTGSLLDDDWRCGTELYFDSE